ncbi:MAG: hypothetical protein AAFY66_15250, partial [Pseudomonadota bacterium]
MAEKNAQRTVLADFQSDIRRVETPEPTPDEARDAARSDYVKRQRKEKERPRRRSRSRDGPSPG